jgi:hypothetical protein
MVIEILGYFVLLGWDLRPMIRKESESIIKNGGQGRDRTADLRVMNPPLSPTELPGHEVIKK